MTNRKRDLSESSTILRCVVGSSLYGIEVESGGDRDEMGICVESFEHFFGMRSRFEQWVYRTKPEGVRSEPGDLDLTVYSLAKWARLALGGNPTILQMLFIPESHILKILPAGRALMSMADVFIGDQIFGPYLGYMTQQRKRLTNKVKMPSRPELVARYGFDTKYAGHLIRLGHQGIELATTGRMQLPLPEPVRSRVLSIRSGGVTEREVLEEAQDLEDRLFELKASSSLGLPDRERVERFVIEQYVERGLDSLS